MTKQILWTLAATSLVLAACGKNEALSRQDNLRGDFMSESTGTYKSERKGNKVYTVTIDAKDERAQSKMTFERVTYFEPECQTRSVTFRQAGTVQYVNNYKDGYLNSMIFQPSDDVSVTFHTDEDVIRANNALIAVGNEQKQQIRVGASVAEAAQVTRDNSKIDAVKALTPFKRDEEKTLNRLQTEKIGSSIGVGPLVEQNSLYDLRYELDTGYLVLHGPGDFAGVYNKQK